MKALLSVVFALGRLHTKSLKNKSYKYKKEVCKGSGKQRHWPKVNQREMSFCPLSEFVR